jgi:CRP/FNR family cyclic AMP-dependent transcriptional regulator
MAIKQRPPFDPKSFLAKVGEGRSLSKYRKDRIIFSQGDPADAVFYIQQGKVKVTVVSDQGKEAVVAIQGPDEILRRRLPGRPTAAHDHSYGNVGV